MPDNTNNQGWAPGNWTPGNWRPNLAPMPQMNYTQPGGGNFMPPQRGPGSGGGGIGGYKPPVEGPPVDRHTAGIVGTAGGTPEGANRGEALPPQFGPNLGANNTTMPGMFSPTGVGNGPMLPQPRQILYDKLYGTLAN